MPVKLLWTPKARADVKKNYVHIGKEQPRSAERYFASVRRKAELLIEYPQLVERHPEVFRTARMLVEAPYVILCGTRPDADNGPIYWLYVVRRVDWILFGHARKGKDWQGLRTGHRHDRVWVIFYVPLTDAKICCDVFAGGGRQKPFP